MSHATTTPDRPLRTRAALGELIALALPIIGMTVSRMLMGFVDFVMVSALGTAAQAAISPATLFVFVLCCLGMGVAQATQTFVSQAEGRGEPHRAAGYTWQSLYIALAVGLLTLPVVVTTPTWFGLIARLGRHTPEVTALEIEYLRIALWSLVPSILCVGMEGFFNGIQRPRVALLAVVAALAVNVVGNWLLIFGQLGFPRMGIGGAALATVIGWWVRTAILTAALLAPGINDRYGTRRALALRLEMLGGLLRVGGPTGLQWLIDIGSWTVFMMLIIPPLGLPALAATNIGLQLMHLSFMPALGLGVALCSQVGFAIGARRSAEARQRANVALAVNAVYMGAVGLLFLALRDPLMRLFTTDPAVIAAGGWVLIWAAVFQVFDAMGITFMNALRGAGDTRWPAILMAVCCWGVFVAGGCATVTWAPEWGLNGPWAMCTLYIMLVGVGLWWRWAAGRWEALAIFSPAVPAGGPAGTVPGEPPRTTKTPAEAPLAGLSSVGEVAS